MTETFLKLLYQVRLSHAMYEALVAPKMLTFSIVLAILVGYYHISF